MGAYVTVMDGQLALGTLRAPLATGLAAPPGGPLTHEAMRQGGASFWVEARRSSVAPSRVPAGR
ncbi:MAG TPA: hypothetical protein VNZ61_22280 [Roseomonas sp.]|nr:hypothetical protein [Roseomonas sp.]